MRESANFPLDGLLVRTPARRRVQPDCQARQPSCGHGHDASASSHERASRWSTRSGARDEPAEEQWPARGSTSNRVSTHASSPKHERAERESCRLRGQLSTLSRSHGKLAPPASPAPLESRARHQQTGDHRRGRRASAAGARSSTRRDSLFSRRAASNEARVTASRGCRHEARERRLPNRHRRTGSTIKLLKFAV